MRVRIAVAVDDKDGSYHAVGWDGAEDESVEREATDSMPSFTSRIVWVEAEIPPPQVVEGSVKENP